MEPDPVRPRGEIVRLVSPSGEERTVVGHPIRDLDGRDRWLASEHADDAVWLLARGFADLARPFEEVHPLQPVRRQAGECHWEARALARRAPRELHMVSGVCGRRAGNMILVDAHSWCTNRKGRILDPTQDAWEEGPYLGVPVPHSLLAEDVSPAYYGLDDSDARWRAYGRWRAKARPLDPKAEFLQQR